MQNVDGYKKDTIMAAFLSPEFLIAIGCMAFFWFTIVSFDAEPRGGDSTTAAAGDVMDQVNSLKAMQMANGGQLMEAMREAATYLQKHNHDVAANICAGNVYVMAGAFDDGLKCLKKSVALSHRNKAVQLNYAQKLAYSKKFDEAINQYEQLTKQYPTWELPKMELAKVYFDQKRPADAARVLGDVLKANSNNFAARKLRGIALARDKKTKQGLEEYMLAVAQEQTAGPPDALKQLLGASAGGPAAMDRIIYELQQQVNNRPDEYVPKLRLAQLYCYGGNAKNAKELMQDARRLAPNNAEVQRTLAVVLKQLGEDNQATSAFGSSVKLEEQQEQGRK